MLSCRAVHGRVDVNALPSCCHAAMVSQISFNPVAGEEQSAAHPAGEREIPMVPVEKILAHSQSSAGFIDRQQSVGARL